MIEPFDGIQLPTESPQPKCVICLKEIVDIKLEENSVWDLNENCLLKVFEIEPGTLESYPSLTYFCQDCTLRNQNLWELYSQIHLLQKSFQEIKVALESDFKSSFRIEDDFGVMDRSGSLRYQLAKSIKILPPEPEMPSLIKNYECESEYTSSPPSSAVSEVPFVTDEVVKSPNDCSDIVPYPSYAIDKSIKNSYASNDAVEITDEESVKPERPLADTKIEEVNRREKARKHRIENKKTMTKLKTVPEVTKLKDLRIKVRAIPPDLLSNTTVNVHCIPGYVPAPNVRSARRTIVSRQKIKDILEAESQSDLEVTSDNDTDFIHTDAEVRRETVINAVRISRKRSAKQVKSAENDKQGTEWQEENQETQVLEAGNSEKAKKTANSSNKFGKGSPPGIRYKFKCPLPECTEIRGFCSKERLELHHKKVHEGITHPFKCDECGKAFRLLNQKNFHYKSVHLCQVNFNCEICGKGFYRRWNLDEHKIIHSEERNYKCPHCPMDFKTRHGKIFHIRYAHTGERPYVCDICGKGFVSSTKLNNHLKCVHNRDDRPIICHICGKNFPIQGYLYMHMRTHEKEDAVAAGLPVKKQPRWKKKSDPSTVEESLPHESSSTAFKGHVEEEKSVLPNNSVSLAFSGEFLNPEKIRGTENLRL